MNIANRDHDCTALSQNSILLGSLVAQPKCGDLVSAAPSSLKTKRSEKTERGRKSRLRYTQRYHYRSLVSRERVIGFRQSAAANTSRSTRASRAVRVFIQIATGGEASLIDRWPIITPDPKIIAGYISTRDVERATTTTTLAISNVYRALK